MALKLVMLIENPEMIVIWNIFAATDVQIFQIDIFKHKIVWICWKIIINIQINS